MSAMGYKQALALLPPHASYESTLRSVYLSAQCEWTIEQAKREHSRKLKATHEKIDQFYDGIAEVYQHYKHKVADPKELLSYWARIISINGQGYDLHNTESNAKANGSQSKQVQPNSKNSSHHEEQEMKYILDKVAGEVSAVGEGAESELIQDFASEGKDEEEKGEKEEEVKEERQEEVEEKNQEEEVKEESDNSSFGPYSINLLSSMGDAQNTGEDDSQVPGDSEELDSHETSQPSEVKKDGIPCSKDKSYFSRVSDKFLTWIGYSRTKTCPVDDLESESHLLVRDHDEGSGEVLEGEEEDSEEESKYTDTYRLMEFPPYSALNPSLEEIVFPDKLNPPAEFDDPFWPTKSQCLELVESTNSLPRFTGTFLTPEARDVR